jgi:hypothetical protein
MQDAEYRIQKSEDRIPETLPATDWTLTLTTDRWSLTIDHQYRPLLEGQIYLLL